MTADELKHFYIVTDSGYPSLEYFEDPDPDSGEETGEHVCFAEAGISLHFMVEAAEKFLNAKRSGS